MTNIVKLDPATFFRRIPLAPHQMRDRVTRTQDAIVLCHLGVPRLDREQWSLTIDGLVERPLALRFGDLMRYRKSEVTSFHQCAGSPLAPLEPTRRICNITWGGARLADVLADCRPSGNAKYIWSYGTDFGEFGGEKVDAYIKDLPIARVEADALIAYEMNGDALPAEHGFPARLVVPGFYGTNSVKWLTRMTLAESRASGPFATRWYNDPVRDDAGRDTVKRRRCGRSRRSRSSYSPAPEDAIELSVEREKWGWAWRRGPPRRRPRRRWRLATGVARARQGRAWQRFSARWTPKSVGRWCWPRGRRPRMACASRYRAVATRSTACR